MKIIEQSATIWGECPTKKEESVLWFENAGRVCYRSEDKIVEGSGIKFVGNIWKRKHFSVIEQSNLVIRTREKSTFPASSMVTQKSIFNSKYLTLCIHQDRIYIGGNWRAWIEFCNEGTHGNADEMTLDNITDFLNTKDYEVVYDQEAIPLPLKAITVELTTDRATTHELVRHRPASYSQESQRYVRYDSIQFIKPFWYDKSNKGTQQTFLDACLDAEESYRHLIDRGMKAEEARAVLPNATATKIVMTANIPEWEHVFNLRLSKMAYSQIRNLLMPVKDDMIEKGWL